MHYLKKTGFLLLALLSCQWLTAQLCSGSLGDPIVNITFGSGSNPGAPLPASVTNYSYIGADCPSDGSYTIRNNTLNCFSGSWHNLTADHTGNTGGYFMLVNASNNPGEFYVDTVRGLCSGTTFEFAAWIANVLKPTACSPNPTQPNLTFSIESTTGVVLQQYNTGTIQSDNNPTWKQYGFYFTTPSGVTDVVLRMVNNAPGGCGNDLALDDITFKPCGPLLTPSISGFSQTEVTICEGETDNFQFNATLSAGYINPTYQWQQYTGTTGWQDIAGENTTSLSVAFISSTPVGSYSYRLTAAEAGNLNVVQCRVVSKALTVRVAANPVTATQQNTPICAGTTATMSATGGNSYSWYNQAGTFTATNSSASITMAQTTHTGRYYVEVTNIDGCKHVDSVDLVIHPKPVIQTGFSDTAICINSTIQLQVSGTDRYEWKPATGLNNALVDNPAASPLVTTLYQVIGFNSFNCTDTAAVRVRVIPVPTVNAGPDKYIIQNTTEVLQATATGENLAFTWTPDYAINNTTTLQPAVTPLVDTVYAITVTSKDGCGVATDQVKVFVYKDIYIPNAFTPNRDNHNPVWIIPALHAYPDFELAVYNRYGQVVFNSRRINIGWDGRYKGVEQPTGTYVYMLDLHDGSPLRKGTLQLLR
ncbi:gliding motility-associated C-terminal domain-containing protein [Terrimonas rubra]|uniref:Gliding motility-associated C-terminal domain-containing protein n=1 Tax=Terrimonas rubra TaxID=1035890 RepID=A0ABW6A457_9BACT